MHGKAVLGSALAWTSAIVLGAGVAGPDAATGVAPPFVVVLGVAQDAGVPQAGCRRDCCRAAHADPAARRHAACLGIVDPETSQRWLVECTPDFPAQLHALDALAPADAAPGLDGILLTHAHIGHYAGLVHLGREVMGARGVPVYALPRLRRFLASSGPWDQLVRLGNIELRALEPGVAVTLGDRVRVEPFLVPHRDEYSETAGFRIRGPRRTVVFLPDIDKWERWDVRLEDLLRDADVAYLDGTFYDAGELPGRDMAEIPHPLIVETLGRIAPLAPDVRARVRFLHLNHTNAALRAGSEAARAIQAAGCRVAEEGERIDL